MLNKEMSKPRPTVVADRSRGVFLFGPFRLDAGERVLLREGEPVALTHKAFDTLLVLVTHGGRLVEKDTLLEEVWPDTFIEEKTLAQNVLTIRKALGNTPDGRPYIETVPKHGYRFAEPVRAIPPGATEIVVETRSRTEIVAEEEFEIESGADAPVGSRDVGGSRDFDATEADASAIARNSITVRDARQGNAQAVLSQARLAQPATAGRRLTRRRLAVAAVVVGCLVLAAGAYVLRRGALGSAQPFREFEITKLTSSGDVDSIAISPDGKYAAYASVGEGLSRLLVRQVGSGGSVEVVPPAEIRYVGITFAKDGAALYYVTRAKDSVVGVLYSIPVLGGGASKKIIEDVDSPVAFSPDGRQLAFVRVSRDQRETALVVADSAGAGERRLAVRAASEGFALAGPAWSPDGRLIACASNADPTTKWSAQLLIVDAEDGSVKPFSSNRWSWIGRAAWSSDGGGVILAAWDNESPTMSDQIWFVSYPGDVPRRITNDINGYLGVSVSADSRVMLTARSERVAAFWIGAMAAAGEAKKAGGLSADLFSDRYGIAWTPDGRIVYASSASGGPNVWVMDGDGANRRQLTSERGGNVLPAVSPDGSSIVFVSYRTGVRHLWRMNMDGSDPRQLTFGEGDDAPTFTPDGEWVVYSAYVAGQPALWKVPAGGGTPARITDFVADSPAVSPDGRLVACYHFDDPLARSKVALVSLADGRIVKELDPPALIHAMGVKWTADGSALAYVAIGGGVSNLRLQPIDGSPARPLTNFTSDHIFRFNISPAGQIVYERGTTVNDAILLRSK